MNIASIREQSTAFAREHVAELAAEIIEWQDTSLLRDGKLRELGAMWAKVDGHAYLRIAESIATRAALELVASKGSDDGR